MYELRQCGRVFFKFAAFGISHFAGTGSGDTARCRILLHFLRRGGQAPFFALNEIVPLRLVLSMFRQRRLFVHHALLRGV